jgi:putative modified peptide
MRLNPAAFPRGMRVTDNTKIELELLKKDYALTLLRRLSEDDVYRAAYEANPAQALRDIGVPESDIAKLPTGYKNIRLASKLVFQTALYQVIDGVAQICLCLKPPQIALGFGEQTPGQTPVTTSFGS